MSTQTPPDKMTLKDTLDYLKAMSLDMPTLNALKRAPSSRTIEEWAEVVQAALSHLEGAQADKGWQPIETCPAEGLFLVYMPDEHPNHKVHVADFHPNVKVIGGLFHFDRKPVTHWTPLPEPPVSAMAAQTEGERP